MSRPYLTIKQYCEKYNVPRTTVQDWVRNGTLEVLRWKRPMLIPDDQPIPERSKDYFNGWRYKREKLPEKGY